MSKGVIFDFNRTLFDPDMDDLVEGCIELLESLYRSGYRLVLISTKTRVDREDQITNLGLTKYFVQVYVIDTDKNERVFQDALTDLGLSPGEVFVVGDRVEGEIAVGNRLGLTTVWFKNGKFASRLPQTSEESPDFTVSSLKEVGELFV